MESSCSCETVAAEADIDALNVMPNNGFGFYDNCIHLDSFASYYLSLSKLKSRLSLGMAKHIRRHFIMKIVPFAERSTMTSHNRQ